jgi:hypothetical protein
MSLYPDPLPFSSTGLPDSPELERELAAAFGWDDESPVDIDAHYESYCRRQAEDELLASYPGLCDKPDADLIALIADPLPVSDADEVAAVAAILIERRLTGAHPRVH